MLKSIRKIIAPCGTLQTSGCWEGIPSQAQLSDPDGRRSTIEELSPVSQHPSRGGSKLVPSASVGEQKSAHHLSRGVTSLIGPSGWRDLATALQQSFSDQLSSLQQRSNPACGLPYVLELKQSGKVLLLPWKTLGLMPVMRWYRRHGHHHIVHGVRLLTRISSSEHTLLDLKLFTAVRFVFRHNLKSWLWNLKPYMTWITFEDLPFIMHLSINFTSFWLPLPSELRDKKFLKFHGKHESYDTLSWSSES